MIEDGFWEWTFGRRVGESDRFAVCRMPPPGQPLVSMRLHICFSSGKRCTAPLGMVLGFQFSLSSVSRGSLSVERFPGFYSERAHHLGIVDVRGVLHDERILQV